MIVYFQRVIYKSEIEEYVTWYRSIAIETVAMEIGAMETDAKDLFLWKLLLQCFRTKEWATFYTIKSPTIKQALPGVRGTSTLCEIYGSNFLRGSVAKPKKFMLRIAKNGWIRCFLGFKFFSCSSLYFFWLN